VKPWLKVLTRTDTCPPSVAPGTPTSWTEPVATNATFAPDSNSATVAPLINKPSASGFGLPSASSAGPLPTNTVIPEPANAVPGIVPSFVVVVKLWRLTLPSSVAMPAMLTLSPSIETLNTLPSPTP